MFPIIQSDDFETENQTTFCETKSSIQLKGFPTFYENGEYVTPINLWMNHLINVKRAKNINSNVRAINRYWRFLESYKLSWKDFPTIKSNKPTGLLINRANKRYSVFIVFQGLWESHLNKVFSYTLTISPKILIISAKLKENRIKFPKFVFYD